MITRAEKIYKRMQKAHKLLSEIEITCMEIWTVYSRM